MKKKDKKEWDTIAQSLYECFSIAIMGLKRHRYITLDDYEYIIKELNSRLKEPKGLATEK